MIKSEPGQVNLNAENVCLMDIELQDEKQLVGLLTCDAYKEYIQKAVVEEVKKSPVEETHDLKVEEVRPIPETASANQPLTLEKTA